MQRKAKGRHHKYHITLHGSLITVCDKRGTRAGCTRAPNPRSCCCCCCCCQRRILLTSRNQAATRWVRRNAAVENPHSVSLRVDCAEAPPSLPLNYSGTRILKTHHDERNINSINSQRAGRNQNRPCGPGQLYPDLRRSRD